MAKERIIKLPQTKGEFKISGNVTGTEKGDNFFKSMKTKTNRDMRIINFGVETKPDSTVYVSLNGMVNDSVYFYKRPEKGEKKGTTKAIPWSERMLFKEEGYRLIGVNVGVTKKLLSNGEQKNDNKMMTPFDATKFIADNLKDNDSVFIRGNIEYSSFKDDKGEIKRSSKFVPSQVSLCSPVDFEKEDFKENNSFKQTIIFDNIVKNDEDKDDIKFEVTARIVTYSSIEMFTFIIRNQQLASMFKKNLKPYTAIEVWGHINNKIQKEEETEEDCWGETNTFDVSRKPIIRELEITGANPSSIDTDTYSEEEIETALRALREFGDDTSSSANSTDDWGTEEPSSNDEDDEWD